MHELEISRLLSKWLSGNVFLALIPCIYTQHKTHLVTPRKAEKRSAI